MSFTTDQKADLLFKKYLGKGTTTGSLPYFSEPKEGRTAIYPNQIWAQYDSIPATASAVSGIVSYIVDLSLIQVPGQSSVNAFYHDNLKDAIPFNFNPNGSYVPVLKKNDNTVIPVGQNDWFLDTEAGVVTFYGGLPSGVDNVNPPKITFYRYIGTKGGGGGGGGGSFSGSFVDFMSGQIEYPVVDNIYHLILNNPSLLYITSMSLCLSSGETTASLKIDNIPVPNLSDLPLIGSVVETNYSSSLASGSLVPLGSRVTLELSNTSVGAGRFYFTIVMNRSLMAT